MADGEMIRVGTLAQLREAACLVVRGADRPVAVFYNDGDVRAVDNRCPHMGFPLSRGGAKDGMITCYWHNARFDAASGCTFDLFADDVPAFDVRVEGDEVFVAPRPRGGNETARALRRLREGLQTNISLIAAKSILVLRGAGVPDADIVREIALHGTRNRDDWASGLTILTTMANLVPHLSPETAYAALYHGAQRVAAETAGRAPRAPRYPLETDEIPLERLGAWLRHWTLVRHRDAAERTVLTALSNGVSPTQVGELLFAAASQRFYAGGGHLLDFCNKAFELLDLIGWEHAAEVLPSLMSQLASARGEEESDAWHHPVNLVGMVREATARLPGTFETGAGKDWAGEAGLAEDLLGDDPEAALRAIVAAAAAGARPEQLGKALAYAAALRVARFGTANEMRDWDTALHTFTYCNALHAALVRCPSPALVPAVLHGAMNLYLTRFLNVPPAHLPGAGESGAEPSEAQALLDGLLAVLDTQQQVSRAARIVAHYLDLGHPVGPLLDTLTWAVVREDAEFHTFQMLEAGIRQYGQWGAGEAGRNILVAVARYLAAHSPTQRAGWQTARIALRLHRGESVYEPEDAKAADEAVQNNS